jgi:hypothetical protein
LVELKQQLGELKTKALSDFVPSQRAIFVVLKQDSTFSLDMLSFQSLI